MVRRSALLFAHAADGGIKAAVDVGDFPGNARRQIGEQEGRYIADIVDGDIAPHRRVFFNVFEDLAEIADAGRSPMLSS